MSYIGNTPTSQAFAPGTDTFSGTGSQTAFTLSRNVSTVNDILVVVNNVEQQPSNYTVSGTTLTFSPAPSSGTNNIYVRYLSTNLLAVAPQQGSVVPSSLSTQNAVYWDTSGNVGIGTTTPEVNSGFTTLSLNNATNSGVLSFLKAGVRQSLIYNDGVGGFNFYADSVTNSALKFYTSGASERLRIDSTGNFSASIPSGSTLYPAHFCRAWVNFNGTGTVAIRASGNVSSITDNGVGDYTVNFATAMPDTNFSGVVSGSGGVNGQHLPVFLGSPGTNDTSSHPNSSSFRFSFYNVTNSGLRVDQTMVNCAIFR